MHWTVVGAVNTVEILKTKVVVMSSLLCRCWCVVVSLLLCCYYYTLSSHGVMFKAVVVVTSYRLFIVVDNLSENHIYRLLPETIFLKKLMNTTYIEVQRV